MKHILIIDDDIHINEMLDKVLKQEGYQVSHAYSGTEALLLLFLCCLVYPGKKCFHRSPGYRSSL